jgi:hypothetical protein
MNDCQPAHKPDRELPKKASFKHMTDLKAFLAIANLLGFLPVGRTGSYIAAACAR